MPEKTPEARRFTALYSADEWARIEAAWIRLQRENPRATITDVVRALARTLPEAG